MQKNSLVNATFYAILDTGYVAKSHWVKTCQALIDGGADLIQLRAKNTSFPEQKELLEAILPLFENTSIPLIINDSVELALSFPNLGLHIGQEDMPPQDARRLLGPNRILGLSTHSIEQASAASTLNSILNYFALGPIFPTQTKPNYQAVGLNLIHEVSKLNSPIPFFCIGGINSNNLHDVTNAGGSRIVAVSDILLAESIPSQIQAYKRQISSVIQPPA